MWPLNELLHLLACPPRTVEYSEFIKWLLRILTVLTLVRRV